MVYMSCRLLRWLIQILITETFFSLFHRYSVGISEEKPTDTFPLGYTDGFSMNLKIAFSDTLRQSTVGIFRRKMMRRYFCPIAVFFCSASYTSPNRDMLRKVSSNGFRNFSLYIKKDAELWHELMNFGDCV